MEEFTTEVYNSDSWRKNAHNDGQYKNKTLWVTDGVRIVISPTYFYLKHCIIYAYVDEQNVKALRQIIIDAIWLYSIYLQYLCL